MARLPVIVGFGGINAAGRSSMHHSYRRMVFDALSEAKKESTIASLRQLMSQPCDEEISLSAQQVLNGSLIRRITDDLFDPDAVTFHEPISVNIENDNLRFSVKRKALPRQIPANWRLKQLQANEFEVTVEGDQDCLVETQRSLKVTSAGQIPTGFDPGEGYSSRNHPRGLQMSVYALSDALGSMGMEWGDILQQLAPDEISVYAGSAMSQLDAQANGGMLNSRFIGQRTTSKQCPFGFAEMPADFANAYALGSLGTTGTSMGACASFLYNLRQGVLDIQSGRARVAIVGSAEAPITPDIINGYAAMNALATDAELADLDGGVLNPRLACRPFGKNCGFTLGESAQYFVLFDHEFALQTGAQIFGGVTDVFVNADGYKRSISAPGAGNYITVAKALASGRGLLGDSIVDRSFVLAHGTGTPQNRVTESDVLSRAASLHGVDSWPVVAVKAFLGHSIGSAGADQLLTSLGIWSDGILPGITTITEIADDVATKGLSFDTKHRDIDANQYAVSIINAKGFGGNNASACVLSPSMTAELLQGQASATEWQAYQHKREETQAAALDYENAVMSGENTCRYLFDNNVLDGDSLAFSSAGIQVPNFGRAVDLDLGSPYRSWLDE